MYRKVGLWWVGHGGSKEWRVQYQCSRKKNRKPEGGVPTRVFTYREHKQSLHHTWALSLVPLERFGRAVTEVGKGWCGTRGFDSLLSKISSWQARDPASDVGRSYPLSTQLVNVITDNNKLAGVQTPGCLCKNSQSICSQVNIGATTLHNRDNNSWCLVPSTVLYVKVYQLIENFQ